MTDATFIIVIHSPTVPMERAPKLVQTLTPSVEKIWKEGIRAIVPLVPRRINDSMTSIVILTTISL